MKENGGKRKVAFASLLSRPDCLIKYTSFKYIDKHTRQNAAPPGSLLSPVRRNIVCTIHPEEGRQFAITPHQCKVKTGGCIDSVT